MFANIVPTPADVGSQFLPESFGGSSRVTRRKAAESNITIENEPLPPRPIEYKRGRGKKSSK